jgi:hypothetical protein
VLLLCFYVISFVLVVSGPQKEYRVQKQKQKQKQRGCDLSYSADWRLDKKKDLIRTAHGPWRWDWWKAPKVRSNHDDGDVVYKEQIGGGAACIIDAGVFSYFQHSAATVVACEYLGVECRVYVQWSHDARLAVDARSMLWYLWWPNDDGEIKLWKEKTMSVYQNNQAKRKPEKIWSTSALDGSSRSQTRTNAKLGWGMPM